MSDAATISADYFPEYDEADDEAIAEEHADLYEDGCYCGPCSRAACVRSALYNKRMAQSHGGLRLDLLAAFAEEGL